MKYFSKHIVLFFLATLLLHSACSGSDGGQGALAIAPTEPAYLPTSRTITRATTDVPQVPGSTAEPALSMTAIPEERTSTPFPSLAPPVTPAGSLLLVRSENILIYEVETGRQHIFFEPDPEWLAWNGAIAPGGTRIGAWYFTAHEIGVFFIDIFTGERVDVLTIDRGEVFDVVAHWQGGDRFYEIGLKIPGTRMPFDVTSWYLLDAMDERRVGSAVNRSGRPCGELGVSPRSGRPAIWCDFAADGESPTTYQVLEFDSSSWMAEMPPGQSVDRHTDILPPWLPAPDGTLLLINNYARDAMVVISQTVPVPFPVSPAYQLTDAVFSPDGLFLAGSNNHCGAAAGQCVKVVELEGRRILWSSAAAPTTPRVPLAWSPDGRFLLLQYPGVLEIVRFPEGEVVDTIPLFAVDASWLPE